MSGKRIAVIPGDGIGVEVTEEALRVLAALDLGIETRRYPYSADHWLATGETLPKGAIAELGAYDAILFGALGDPRVPDQVVARDVLLGLRFQLDLYINLRPVTLLDDRLTPLKGKTCRDIDFVVFRENTEGSYAGVGGNFKRDTADEIAITEDVNTRKGVERIQRAAFACARAQGQKKGRRPRLCMSDKANAMPHAHGLWQRVFAALKKEYSDVDASHLYIDVCALEFVRVGTVLDAGSDASLINAFTGAGAFQNMTGNSSRNGALPRPTSPTMQLSPFWFDMVSDQLAVPSSTRTVISSSG